MTPNELVAVTALEALVCLWDKNEIDQHPSADGDEIELAFEDARRAANLIRGRS